MRYNVRYYSSSRDEVNNPKEVYVFDISSIVSVVHETFKSYYQELPVGIYYAGECIVSRDRPAISQLERDVLTYKDLQKTGESVATYDGFIIPPRGRLRELLDLRSEKTTDTIARYIIEDSIKAVTIDCNAYSELLPYDDLGVYTNRDIPFPFIYDHLDSEGVKRVKSGVLNPFDILSDLIEVVEALVLPRATYIWKTRVKGDTLELGYTLDVRAYRYMKNREEADNHAEY